MATWWVESGACPGQSLALPQPQFCMVQSISLLSFQHISFNLPDINHQLHVSHQWQSCGWGLLTTLFTGGEFSCGGSCQCLQKLTGLLCEGSQVRSPPWLSSGKNSHGPPLPSAACAPDIRGSTSGSRLPPP